MKNTFRPFDEVGAELLQYFSLAESGVMLGAASGRAVWIPAALLPTLEEWRADPELTEWRARVPAEVAEAWRRMVAAEVEERPLALEP